MKIIHRRLSFRTINERSYYCIVFVVERRIRDSITFRWLNRKKKSVLNRMSY